MKYVITLIMLFVTSLAFGEQFIVHVEGKLSNEQKAAVALLAQQKAVEPASSTTVSKIQEWTNIGTAIGSGLASSARELGIAANAFATTPVGKFAIVLIAWHFIGAQLIHVGVGLLWLVTMLPLWVYLYKRMQFTVTVTYFDKDKGPNGARKVVARTVNKVQNATEVMYWFFLIGIIFVGITVIFTF